MTNRKPSFRTSKDDRGVNEKTLQDSLPSTKELDSKIQRVVLDTSSADND